MYTAKSLTYYRNAPEGLMQPPEGPNSGYLVIKDKESTATSCFGLCKETWVEDLPFPQNKLLTVSYGGSNQDQQSSGSHDEVYLIPVINQPLSSNLYYAIKADGKRKGEAYACSKDEDMTTSCCGTNIKDAKPRSFDSEDIYQQFQFSTTAPTCCDSAMLVAKSVAPDGHPPRFIRREGWRLRDKTPRNFTLGEISGINPSLRVQLPDFNFSISQQCSTPPLVVGTWYCPFMFIIEGTEKERIKNSVFYEMTLEQVWQRVFSVDNNGYGHADNKVIVDIVVPTEVIRIGGQLIEEPPYLKNDDNNKVVWFKNTNGEVGLSKLIVDRMMWEEERVGWVKGKEGKDGKEGKKVRVVKEEMYEGLVNGWRSFGLYVLVESFVLKRNNGNVVMTYDFMHTHQVRSKWE